MRSRRIHHGVVRPGQRSSAPLLGASLLGLSLLGTAGAPPAQAQITCARAETPLERAICASPALLDKDARLAEAYRAAMAQAQAQSPAKVTALRQAQREWIAARNQDCGRLRGAALEACLNGSFASRIATLAPTGAPTAAPTAPPAPAQAPVAAQPQPSQASAAAAAPLPAPIAPPPLVSGPTAPVPGGPLPAPFAPAARLERSEGPADAAGFDTLLQVTSPGRFTLRAESPTPVTLQLVDMLSGPGALLPGRVDAWLDTGTYKLRLRGGEGATAPARLSVTAAQALPPQRLLPGRLLSTTLADGQAMEAWITVDSQRRIRLEAAGRSLADLQLWRDGRTLVGTERLQQQVIRPTPAQPLQRILLTALLEPGSYRVTAGGGAPLAWADGATDQPLHLRLDATPALLAGPLEDRIGPFGSNLYRLETLPTQLQLAFPEPAAVTATLLGGSQVLHRQALTPQSRQPLLSLRGTPSRGTVAELLVEGTPGQPFRLSGFAGPARSPPRTPGEILAFAEAPGLGGDAAPAQAALLLRQPGQPDRVLAAAVPRLDDSQAWRTRFNLSGSTNLLIEVAAPGIVALTSSGAALRATLRPLARPAAGTAPPPPAPPWDLTPGWYLVTLAPVDAGGPVDVTLGRPGLPQPEPALQPANPVLPLGRHALAEGGALRLLTNQSEIGLLTYPAPLPAESLPLTLTQLPGAALSLPLAAGTDALVWQLPDGTRLTARADAAGQLQPPATDRPRQLTLARDLPAPPLPPVAPRALPALPVLRPGVALPLDLAAKERRSLVLELAEGGLLRLESLGRLGVAAELGTDFQPGLASAEANGAGGNILIQRALRAGRYQLAVTAAEGAGRLRLLARPAPLLPAPTLLPGAILRLPLPAGSGAAVPLRVATAGTYRLEMPNPGVALAARLEDAGGWPLLPPGTADGITLALQPGDYRLVVEPPEVDARLVARLVALDGTAAQPAGHGPHPLAFGTPQALRWREPATRDAPRLPDQWDFTLAGPAAVSLRLSEGMGGTLARRDGGPVLGPVLARIGDATPFEGELPAGDYRLSAMAIGRNDQLDYTVALDSAVLQPGAARRVTLPASLPLAIAEDRVVSLRSFGGQALRATLRDAGDRVVMQQAGDAADWNLGFSAPLPAGGYTLQLDPVLPPAEPGEAEGEGQEEADMAAAEAPAGPSDPLPEGQVEVMLRLPAPLPPQPMPPEGSVQLQGEGVHRLVLPALQPGALLLARATAAEGPRLALALEAPQPDGRWRVLATARGTAPVLAVPVAEAAGWRLAVWPEEASAAPIDLQLRQASPAAQAPDAVTLAPVDGLPGLALAAIDLPDALALTLPPGLAALQAGSSPGQPLQPAGDAPLLPQSRRMWLLAEGAPPPRFALAGLRPDPAQVLTMTLPAGATATLPASPGRIWLAEAARPVLLQTGGGLGLAEGSSLAAARDAALRLRAADGAALRLVLRALDPAAGPAQALPEAGLAAILPPNSARRLRLPAGAKRLRAELPAGVALLLGPSGPVLWAGGAPLSRLAEGDWPEALLVNTGAAPAPAALTLLPGGDAPLALGPDAPFRRFFGTAGSLLLPLRAAPGQQLAVAGARVASILTESGALRRPGEALDGPAWAVLEHGPGPVLAWLEGPGATPWPAAPPQPAPLPGLVPLAGDAMQLVLNPATPVLLHAESSAPLVLVPPDGVPLLFPAGAALHRYLPAGSSAWRLLAPQSGGLSGSLALSATPVRPMAEGLGEPLLLAPGGTALWGFTLDRPARIGLGLQAEPDRAEVRLLDATGRVVGEGVAQLAELQPGTWLVEARIPADAPPTRLRPALLGLQPRAPGPPEELLRAYQALAAQPAATQPAATQPSTAQPSTAQP